MDKKTPNIEDFIEWDIENWSKSIPFWEKHLTDNKKLTCLELGGRRGGLSLWLSTKGHKVICSDITNINNDTQNFHKTYGAVNITYKNIDATNISFNNEFDIIIFKSMLGAIGRVGGKNLVTKSINSMYNALKPGGKLLFAENLKGSFCHIFFRKLFVPWGKSWRYTTIEKMTELLSIFSECHFKTIGFLGVFGRTEKQKQFLGKIDNKLVKILPQKWRYLIIGVAIK